MTNVPPILSRGDATGDRSPLGFLPSMLSSVRPPDWMVDELQNRVVLFLNHVLMQEPQAQERLRRQKGKPVRVQWGGFHLTLAATPAGLLERPGADAQAELTVTLTQASPWSLLQSVVSGVKPAVDIQGDVQLAAEVAWLTDNVRWDVEEDLSRLLGDATAHTLSRVARTAAQAVKGFVSSLPVGRGVVVSPDPAGASTPAVGPAGQDHGSPL